MADVNALKRWWAGLTAEQQAEAPLVTDWHSAPNWFREGLTEALGREPLTAAGFVTTDSEYFIEKPVLDFIAKQSEPT